MLPASNTGAGMNMGFPDVCNTPSPTGTVPIPYPNMANNAQASPFSNCVRISSMNALNMSSKIPATMGDEAGVAHSSFMKQAAYTMGNPCVFIESQPGINLACPTSGNNMNAPLAAVTVPSAVNVFYTFRAGLCAASAERGADPYTRELDGEDLARLGEAMDAPAVSARRLAGEVAYLRIDIFNASVPTLVFRAIRKLGRSSSGTLIVDLRGNPGGDLAAMLRLADDFLPRDTILVRQVDDEGTERVMRARQADPYEVGLVVLVDGDTASAAELFAGCLQHHGRAQLVGEPTFGKGRLQKVVPDITGKGVLYASVACCRLPDGREVEGRGIKPDVTVGPGDGVGDRQLDTALALLG
ncbi:MAG: hypothetical protein DRI90_13555 [Deltaproteobacteria bacterium]|nr:MAG: hypothetical protein DRI90_13555 [Deltaproteobacteria bacterium]